MKLSEVLVRPVLSEKINKQTEKMNRYAFIVGRKANKIEIKKAVEAFSLSTCELRTRSFRRQEMD